MLSLLLGLAQADTPMLYTGDLGVAVRRVSEDGVVPAWDLDPVTLAAILPRGGLQPVGSASMRRCPAPVLSNAALREAVDRAERLLMQQEWDGALAKVDGAIALLPCASEPADASLYARLYFVDGIGLVQDGQAVAAEAAFLRVFYFTPGAAWDPTFPEGQVEFDRARERFGALHAGELWGGPGATGGPAIWVDGRPVRFDQGPVPLVEGPHILQILDDRVDTWEVTLLAADRLAILDPIRVEAAGVGAFAGDPTVLPLLDVTFGRTGPVWAWTGEETWQARPSWLAVPPSTAAQAAARERTGRTLTLLGTGVAFSASTLGIGLWKSLAADQEGPPGEGDWEAVKRGYHYTALRPFALGALGVSGAGLAVAGAGLVIWLRPPATVPPASVALEAAVDVGGDAVASPGRP